LIFNLVSIIICCCLTLLSKKNKINKSKLIITQNIFIILNSCSHRMKYCRMRYIKFMPKFTMVTFCAVQVLFYDFFLSWLNMINCCAVLKDNVILDKCIRYYVIDIHIYQWVRFWTTTFFLKNVCAVANDAC